MKYIIMADGKGKRWKNHNGVPKHFAEIGGEAIIERTVRLLRKMDPVSEIIITSHDPGYELEGTVRHEPKNNVLEIDRFTEELIENEICFLYGDTYYSEDSLKTIIERTIGEITFFGNHKSIVAIKVKDGDLFKKHVEIVKGKYLAGQIDVCVGWQVYQSYVGIEIGRKKVINGSFINVFEEAFDVNTPKDYEERTKES